MGESAGQAEIGSSQARRPFAVFRSLSLIEANDQIVCVSKHVCEFEVGCLIGSILGRYTFSASTPRKGTRFVETCSERTLRLLDASESRALPSSHG